MSEKIEKNKLAQNFVEFIIKISNADKGVAATLRRADNPATEYQCWEYCLPHARGGVSLIEVKSPDPKWSSPRAWGCFCISNRQ